MGHHSNSPGKALIAEGKPAGPKRKSFVFVNNQLEGNAISTIAAMMSRATAIWTDRCEGSSGRTSPGSPTPTFVLGLLKIQSGFCAEIGTALESHALRQFTRN